MNPLSSYISSLQAKKPSYGNLFSNLKAPTSLNLSLTKPAAPAPAPTPVAKPPVQSAAPASTSPAPVPSTPAKSTYISTLANSPAPKTTPTPVPNTTTSTAPGADSQAYRDYLAQYSGAVKTSGEASKEATETKKKSEDSEYLNYLKTLFDPAELKKAQETTKELNERTSREILRAREEEDRLRKNESGQLKTGQSYLLGENERLSNRSLADLALAKGANLDVYNQMIAAGKSVYEAETAQKKYDDERADKEAEKNKKDPFSLSEGQSRYEFDPKTGTYTKVASVGKTYAPGTGGISTPGGTYVAGANPTVDSWANRIQSGQAKITDIPASQTALRNAVTVALDAMGNSADGKPVTTEIGKQALATAKELLTKFQSGGGYNNAVGGSSLFNSLALPGTQRSDFKIAFQSLKDQLSLDAVKLLKGQGAVSDAERALLASAVTKLNLSQSEGDFKKTLQDVISKLEGNASSAPTGDSSVLRSPDGTQEVTIADLTPEELAEAKAQGWK